MVNRETWVTFSRRTQPRKVFFGFGTGQLSLATQAFPGSGSPRDVRSQGGQGAMAAMAAMAA